MSKSPLFQFVHATDPHWGEPYSYVTAPANARSDRFIDDVGRLSPKPRFAVITGDITEWGFSRADELAIGAERLTRMPVTTYFVPGNHDLSPGPTEDEPTLPPIQETNWYKRFGEESLFWTAVEGSLELIGFALRDGDPDGILDRLAAQLAQPARGHRILVSHYPLYSVRDGGILQWWGPDAIGQSLDRLKELCAKHADTVVAYLFGHIHVISAQVHDRVLHVAGAPLAAGAPGYRLFTVYENGISCRFVPLSDESLVQYDFWGLIKPQFGISPWHPTRYAYHAGHLIEREFYFDFRRRRLEPLDSVDA